MLPPSFDARVIRTRALSPSVREIAFERVDGQRFDFDPGQWVSLVLPVPPAPRAESASPDAEAPRELRRAYSIASPPSGDASFDIAVTRVDAGAGSAALHALSPGDVVRAIGPQGFFTRRPDEPQPSLLIGTGTGVAPLRSMLRAAEASRVPVWLLFGGREEHDLLYRDELAAVVARRKAPHAPFRVEQTLSRGSASWEGRRGHVQIHARELYEELARTTGSEPHVYICGLERMVGGVRALFRQEMGLPRQLVHSERYD